MFSHEKKFINNLPVEEEGVLSNDHMNFLRSFDGRPGESKAKELETYFIRFLGLEYTIFI